MMTVGELKAKLANYPENLPVRLSVARGGCCGNERCYCDWTVEEFAGHVSSTWYSPYSYRYDKKKQKEATECVLIGES